MYTMHDAKFMAEILAPGLERLGLYIAVAGGTLTKMGARKDIDLVLYGNRQTERWHWPTAVDDFLFIARRHYRVTDVKKYGFCTKMKLDGIPVDLLVPEFPRDADAEGNPYGS